MAFPLSLSQCQPPPAKASTPASLKRFHSSLSQNPPFQAIPVVYHDHCNTTLNDGTIGQQCPNPKFDKDNLTMNHLTRIIIALILTIFSCTTQAGEGALALTIDPNDAEIYINGILKANSSPIVLRLPEGKHRLEVSKPGKQSQHLEVVIGDGAVVAKKIVLVDEKKLDFTSLLTLKKGEFETVQEFEKRWQQLIEDYNKAVQHHDPRYQAGVAHLLREDYDLASGTFPVRLKSNSWLRSLNPPTLSNIAALREDAKALWEEGSQKPVFVYLALHKNKVVIKQTVLTGINKEWTVQNIVGLLSSRMPKSLTHLIDSWQHEYKTRHPQIKVQSQPYTQAEIATVFSDLLEGTSNLIFLPRPMTAQEIQTFTEKFGYAPTGLRVGLAAVAVYVHHDNPIKGLTIPQLDAIFSTARKCGGAKKEAKVWGDLGVTNIWMKDTGKWLGLGGGEAVAWDKLTIQLFGHSPESTVAELFQEIALCKGEWKQKITLVANSETAIEVANRAVNNLSFARLTEESIPDVKALPIENKGSGYLSDWVKPTLSNAMSGQYPLARPLWLYVNKRPHKLLPPVQNEFIKFIGSDKGQALLTASELLSFPDEVVKEELAILEKVTCDANNQGANCDSQQKGLLKRMDIFGWTES